MKLSSQKGMLRVQSNLHSLLTFIMQNVVITHSKLKNKTSQTTVLFKFEWLVYLFNYFVC